GRSRGIRAARRRAPPRCDRATRAGPRRSGRRCWRWRGDPRKDPFRGGGRFRYHSPASPRKAPHAVKRMRCLRRVAGISLARMKAGRRSDLDWFRIGAPFLLSPFPVGKTFDVLPIYHIKNAELSSRLDYFTFFIHQWHMPLFFVLAGWSAYASIAAR